MIQTKLNDIFQYKYENINNFGIPIIIIPEPKMVQTRKHKKKRINKKWAKIYGYHKVGSYFDIDEETIYAISGKLYMRSKAYEKLKESVEILHNLDEINKLKELIKKTEENNHV